MSECCDPVPPPPEATNPPPIVPGDPGDAELVLDPGKPNKLTTREETDAVGAMRRGLAEYLGRAEKDVAGARVRFQSVLEEWGEPDDENVRYPAAAVLVPEEVLYDAVSMTPGVFAEQLPDGRNVVKVSEASCDLLVEIHTSEPGERLAISMLLEAAMNPVDFMYGFILELPFYFGMRAVYALTSSTIPDDEASARHGLRALRLKLAAHIPVVRPRKLPEFQPKLALGVADPTTPNAPRITVTAGIPSTSGGALARRR